MFEDLVFGCGQIPLGDWVAASFNKDKILGQNLASGGIWYPGQIPMGGTNLSIYPVQKNLQYHNKLSDAWLVNKSVV